MPSCLTFLSGTSQLVDTYSFLNTAHQRGARGDKAVKHRLILPAAYRRLRGRLSVCSRIRRKCRISSINFRRSLRLFASMASRSCYSFGKVPYKTLSRSSIGVRIGPLNSLKPSNMATIATYKVPRVENENNVRIWKPN